MATYDTTKVTALVQQCRTATGNHAKGEAMADLVEYAFGLLDGITLKKRGHLAADGSGEIDFVFAHDPKLGRLPLFNVTLFVECKNEATKIGAPQVRIFGSKLGERNQRVGVMVTRKGLSGSRFTHAHKIVSDELRQGRSIVIITLDDLEQMTDTPQLEELFHARLEELEFQGSYTTI
jgi:hypothetical protein